MNTVTLSKRMQALADLVDSNAVLCDVGCDHGYLPIWLIENKVIQKAYACDINQGPLARAEENISKAREAGTIPENCITLRLSNGLDKMNPGEATEVLIAGMGGNLVLDILKAKKDLAASMDALILQPQSDIAAVRRWLLAEGYEFLLEDMIEEDGKYYPMMKVKKQEDHALNPSPKAWTPAQIRYGKLLIEKKHPVLKEFLLREENIKGGILSQLDAIAVKDERTNARRQEVKQNIDEIRLVLAEMGEL